VADPAPTRRIPPNAGKGRRLGVPNKATTEVRELARKLIADQDYKKNFKQRWRTGDIPPQVETMIWHYAYGKPKETHVLEGPDAGPLRFTLKLDSPNSDA